MKNPKKGIASICKEENAANNKRMEQCMVAYAAQAQRTKPTQGSTAFMLTVLQK